MFGGVSDRLVCANNTLWLDEAKREPLRSGVNLNKWTFFKKMKAITNSQIALEIDHSTAWLASQEYFFKAMDKLKPLIGKPEIIYYQLQHDSKSALKLMELAKQEHCDWKIKWLGEYPKGFDPFARPTVIEHDLYYPVVSSVWKQKVKGLTEGIFFLDLQITVHHTSEASSLLLHTQRDYSFLEELVAESGLDVELIREPDE
jgi:hypothetical protein